eukprot:CAMPEP_0206601554 /NCGR_PEP_ID=MMETSP0325_2-20121206/46712_1 /ASSEMBLY_ACC=CAM_ASM_000347 /TAXON_ID=2866 /ORGANISM="Crypthecodinium cohnii, Strain Seligo" /LENGTH=89 /DNA_ID=CAMNT_0054113575 /DNA_START=641 /DNA_END=907 /DNA_ORIENTATION=+
MSNLIPHPIPPTHPIPSRPVPSLPATPTRPLNDAFKSSSLPPPLFFALLDVHLRILLDRRLSIGIHPDLALDSSSKRTTHLQAAVLRAP